MGFEYSVDNQGIFANVLRKYFQIFQNHRLLVTVRIRADRLRPVFTDLGVLFDVPFSVEAVFPKWAVVGVGLVISFAVGALEGVRARFALFSFKSRRVDLGVSFTTPTDVPVMFRFVGPITFDAFGPSDSARECGVSPFPAVFTLGDSRIHVRSSDRGDILAHIEASVNEKFGVLSALHIPNIDPNDGHIGFWQYFDNPWLGCEGDIVEYVVLFENRFNIRRGKLLLGVRVRIEWNSHNFQVGFGLG